MSEALFVIGALTSLGCGWQLMVATPVFRYDVLWLIGGTLGAAIMVTAVLIERGTI